MSISVDMHNFTFKSYSMSKFIKNKLKAIRSLLSLYKLDKNEQQFIKEFPSKENQSNKQSGKIILFQMPMDYYYLAHFALIAKQYKLKGYKLVGLWPMNVYPKTKNNYGCLKNIRIDILNSLQYTILKHKWIKLYRSIGIENCIDLDQISLLKKIQSNKKAQLIFSSLTNKDSLYNLNLNDLNCGDLIYDTYLRFRAESTIDIHDSFLKHLIYKSLVANIRVSEYCNKNGVKKFYSSYSSYIQHGIPVRTMLKRNVAVFTDGNLSQYGKKVTLEDYYHTANYHNYRNDFALLTQQADKLAQADDMLKKRFSGNIDSVTSYMKNSAYGTQIGQLQISGAEGVVFLHDFFDSPHCYSWMIFLDFWEWALFTLQLISEYNLNIAVKPHPNQRVESLEVVQTLKQMFPNIIWIDQSISNSQIFASGIKYGISIYGTVLHELAYHNIVAIAAGDNPHISFDFVYTARSQEEYKQLILNAPNLKVAVDAKKQVQIFCYMHALNHNDAIISKARDLELRSLNPENSLSLIKFLALINTHKGPKI